MAGKKTHDQQLRIIEKRVDISNAGEDFPAEEDLKRSEKERQAQRRDMDVKTPQRDLTDPDDRNVLRGANQESRHNKERTDD